MKMTLSAQVASALVALCLPAAALAEAPSAQSNFNVTYAVELDRDGTLLRLEPLPSIDSPALEQVIEKEVRSWTFQSAQIDGKPVPTRTYLRLGVSSPGLDPARTQIISATTGPAIRSMKSPGYPADAFRRGEGGLVVLKLKLDAKGNVRGVVPMPGSSKNRSFTEAAAASARYWRFLPEQADGQAVAGAVLIPVCFQAQSAQPQACDWTGPDGQTFKPTSVSVAIQPAARITSDLAILGN
jgi:TonB family protein